MKRRQRVVVWIEQPGDPVAVIQILKKFPGHRTWELDVATGLITQAYTKSCDYEMTGGITERVTQREGCMYCTALSAHTADFKFMKMIAVHNILEAQKMKQPANK